MNIGRILLLPLILAATACGGTRSAVEDASVISSTRYDDVPCAQLVAQRNDLAARFGLARNVERPSFEGRRAGLGVIMPDLRSETTRQQDQAVYMVHAMSRSIERRNCEGEDRDDRR